MSPFRIPAPAIIAFSGGRSSGYMLWRILQAYEGVLPPEMPVVFANTGREMPQTLDFVKECEHQWNVPVRWVEYQEADAPSDRWREVTYETASRAGEPFEAMLRAKKMLPNPTMRFCTSELKIKSVYRWAQAQGLDAEARVVGLRADEPRRVSRMRNADTTKHPEGGRIVYLPLAEAGIRREDVGRFWETAPFDLRLVNNDGRTPAGNCDLCFMKQTGTLLRIMSAMPHLADWWIDREREAEARRTEVRNVAASRFRRDRPSYAELQRRATSAGPALFDAEDVGESVDCFCTD